MPLGTNLIGDDAFYEANEGDSSHDRLFSKAYRRMSGKAGVLVQYAKSQTKAKIAKIATGGRQCGPTSFPRISLRRVSTVPANIGKEMWDDWLGKTIPHYEGKGRPAKDSGISWSAVSGERVNVRCGPDYAKTGKKMPSIDTLYECLSVDLITADCKVEDILGRLIDLPADLNDHLDERDLCGGVPLRWWEGCALPRILLVNVQLPYRTGPLAWGSHPKWDYGCSAVAIWHIKPETLQKLRRNDPNPAIRLFERFCRGPCGEYGGSPGSPDRALGNRRLKGVKPNNQGGLFKGIAFGENPDDVPLFPQYLMKHNGKPCLITNSGTIVKDNRGEFIEIGIDVRKFSSLARSMLYNLRDLLESATVQLGFLIQGTEDSDLPEMLLCDLRLHNCNFLKDSKLIYDPRSEDH